MTDYSHVKPLLEYHAKGVLDRLSIPYHAAALAEYCHHLYGSADWQFVHSGGGNPSGAIGIRPLKWDSNIYGVKIGALGVASLDPDLTDEQKKETCQGLIQETLNLTAKAGYQMLVCRVPLAELVWTQTLEQNGFFTTDVQCPLACKHPQDNPKIIEAKAKADIREARLDDLGEIIVFGKSAFGRSHLYADPGLPIKLSDALHEEWLKNDIVKGRAEFTLVADVRGEIAGFVSALWDDTQKEIFDVGHGHIDLIAVQNKFQKKGFGSLLLAKAMQRFKNSGAALVTVSTQATNLNAIKLYQQNSFNLSGFEVTLHSWL